MKKAVVLLSAVLLMAGFKSPETGTITVSISNVKETGTIHIGLYKDGDEFPDKTKLVKGLTTSCQSNCEVKFEGIPFGTYAIAIYQDLNGNNELDTGMFGIPKEPFAFSNNFKPRFGGPSFEKCQFTLGEPGKQVDIQLINSLFGD